MEFVSGPISIKHILLHNNNWGRFFKHFRSRIRWPIILNILKTLCCGTSILGFHQYECECGYTKIVAHTCKSRLCNKCGKKATDIWVAKNLATLPNTKWQHITMTLPKQLRPLFWLNRGLLNSCITLSAKVLQDLSKEKGITLGIFVVPHTFGRKLNPNVHFHVSTTAGGITYDNLNWRSIYFYHGAVKAKWRYAVIDLLRNEYKAGNLALPKSLAYINGYTAFNSWLDFLYKKKWVAYLQKITANHKRNIEYLGKYLKRPPIAESRIKKYDGKEVTFTFFDHHTKSKKREKLPVMQFIGNLVMHVYDYNFRSIRYYGFLANRVRTKMLAVVNKILSIKNIYKSSVSVKWRELFLQSFGIDPLVCPNCQGVMRLTVVAFAKGISYLFDHQKVIFKGQI